MATRGDAGQATREAARLGISTVVEGVATGVIEIGTATPVIAPLCLALLKAKGVIDGASRNNEELEELCERCDLITVQVIDKAKGSSTSPMDVSPLQECVDKLDVVARRYHDQGRLARLAQCRRDGDDIQRLRARIEAVVPIMGLTGVVTIVDQLEQVRQMLARLQPRAKLAPVPRRAPVTKSSHVVRDAKVDRVCKILGTDDPAVAALTGRSGAGKTTAAAAMVGERGPVRPHPGETEDQARARLNRVRELFPDGVVWLRVGKGEGAADRLPSLMLSLAKRLHEDVMEKGVDAPAVGEDGESYVRRIVSQESLRCLVVADDVWEVEVVEKLRKMGVWVLLTTRFPEMVGPSKRVVMDTLTEIEAEDVLRCAAEMPPGERLCDAAREVLKICGRVAMDVAFVGSWSSVRAANGVPKSKEAWAGAVRDITAQIDLVRDQGEVGNAGGMDGLDVNRLAVLRAGFEYLGANAVAQKLYVMLTVFPDGYAFGKPDAAVLVGDEEVTMGAMAILERWGVLKADTSGRYRMHDAHVDFARGKLMGWEYVRKPAVDRWTLHMSRLDVVLSIDTYALVRRWHALERVGGTGWFKSRAYDDHIFQMDALDPSKARAVQAVGALYGHDGKFHELDEIMKKVLEQCDEFGGDSCPGVRMVALFFSSHSLGWQGRLNEWADVDRRLVELADPQLELHLSGEDHDVLRLSTTFNMYGYLQEQPSATGMPRIGFGKQ